MLLSYEMVYSADRVHVHRPLVNTGRGRQQPSRFAARRHQGLAVIYRDGLDVTVYRLQSTCSPTTFDCQVVKVKSGKSSNVIAKLYRKPDPAVAPQLFLDELFDLFNNLSTSSGAEVIVCGDLNCRGDASSSVDNRLATVFDLFNMVQLVHSPTREDNLLDVLVCSDGHRFVHDVVVKEAGRISDHRLVKAQWSIHSHHYTPSKPLIY